MERIVNYLDIPEEKRDAVMLSLPSLGFISPAGLDAAKAEMDRSRKDSLPQFLFVFRDEELIGYQFLIAEKEHTSKAFPWWAVGNPDELPITLAVTLLEESIRLSTAYGCLKMAKGLNVLLENNKKGLGRRPEHLCR